LLRFVTCYQKGWRFIMTAQSKHASINISLIQAREALMTQFRPILNNAGITDQQWRIIRLLAENGTLDFQDLANQACILRPSLTGILTRLEKVGYVVRLKPSNDQRRVYLKLTGEGEKLHRTTCDQVDARYDVIESVLSKDKLKQLQSLLGELSAIGQHID
jgi:homoprotocatechuate degradation regulator HpaR